MGCCGLARRRQRQIDRDASGRNRHPPVVDHHVGPAGFSINARNYRKTCPRCISFVIEPARRHNVPPVNRYLGWHRKRGYNANPCAKPVRTPWQTVHHPVGAGRLFPGKPARTPTSGWRMPSRTPSTKPGTGRETGTGTGSVCHLALPPAGEKR